MCFNRHQSSHTQFFCNVGPPKESIFFDQFLWPIFQSSLHMLQITILSWYRPSVGSFHVLHLHLSFWLVGTYIHSCCTSVVWSWISYIPLHLISSLFHPCWRAIILVVSLHLSSLICCVWTVAIRVSGVDHLIGLLFRTTSCCWMPPWLLYLPLPLVLVFLSIRRSSICFLEVTSLPCMPSGSVILHSCPK